MVLDLAAIYAVLDGATGLPCAECGGACCRHGTVALYPGEAERSPVLAPLEGPPVAGQCRFLDGGGRCTVYASRPLNCRAFPLLPSGEPHPFVCPFLDALVPEHAERVKALALR